MRKAMENDCAEVLAFCALQYKPNKGGSKVAAIGMMRHNKPWAREYFRIASNVVIVLEQMKFMSEN